MWRALTEPEQVTKWWGPNGFSAPVIKIDLRVGGKYLYCMRASPELEKALGRRDFWSTGTYREIAPLKRLVVTDSFSDEKGNVVSATYYGMSKDFALETTATFTFEREGAKTKMRIHYYPGIPEGESLEQARQGWNESFDKLAKFLKEQ